MYEEVIEVEKKILHEKINKIAEKSGIDVLGYANASEFSGYALNHSKRRDPKLSLPDAETIIVAGVYIGGVSLPAWSDPWYGQTSHLYLSGYFSDVVEPLLPIARYLRDEGYTAIICNESTSGESIIPLKLAAIRAGFGWQGKNSLLITKKYGSFLALGGIVTNAVLEHNIEEEPNRCTKCNRCQEACPVSALDQPHVLNRERCLSNLLMSEHSLEEVKQVIGNRVGDCEICQKACPWNKKHLENPLKTALTTSFKEQTKTWEELFYLPALEKMTEEEYKTIFIERLRSEIPYKVFRRNVRIAMESARNLES